MLAWSQDFLAMFCRQRREGPDGLSSSSIWSFTCDWTTKHRFRKTEDRRVFSYRHLPRSSSLQHCSKERVIILILNYELCAYYLDIFRTLLSQYFYIKLISIFCDIPVKLVLHLLCFPIMCVLKVTMIDNCKTSLILNKTIPQTFSTF